MKLRDRMMRHTWWALLLGWGLTSLTAHAQTAPSAWTNNCASCHNNAGSYPLPNFDEPTITPSVHMQSASAFKTYVNGRYPAAAMTGLSADDAAAIWPYLTKRIYGEFSLADGATPLTFNSNRGAVNVGSSNDLAITITNHHGQDLPYSTSGVTASSANHFFVSSTSCSAGGTAGLSGTIKAGGTCTLTVRFAPKSTGALNATLTFTGRGLARTVNLSGTGQAPTFSIGSNALNFGSITVGNTANSSTSITNTGSATLTLSSIVTSGTHAAEFTVAGGNSCVNGTALSAGSSCTLARTFAPGATGSRTASIAITHNATGSPANVSLSGSATPAPAPTILTSTSTVAYGDVQLGSSGSSSVTVTNNGTAPLTFSSFNLSGTHAADFSRSGTCSTASPLGIGASCTVGLSFTPGALGNRTASLTINSNADNGNPSLSLTGRGVPVPAPVVSWAQSSLAFGAQTVGGVYANKMVTLSNTGDAALTINSLSAGSGAFSVVGHTCGGSLAAGASCTVTVRYAPASANGGETGALTLSSNAAGSPHAVTLSGQGLSYAVPVLAWSPTASTHDFGNVVTGQTSSAATFTLSNAGPGGATLGAIRATGVQAAQFALAGGTCTEGTLLYEGDTCTVQVTFNPGVPGSAQAQLEVNASSASLPNTIALNGAASGGPTAMMDLSQTTLTFDSTRLGAAAVPQDLEITNSGSGTLVVSGWQTSGGFDVSSKTCGDLPFSLAAGERCTVSVRFQPSATGRVDGTVSITSNAANATTVTVAGTGQAAANVSSGAGGCSMVQGRGPTDPTLWAMVAVASGILWRRRRRHGAPQR